MTLHLLEEMHPVTIAECEAIAADAIRWSEVQKGFQKNGVNVWHSPDITKEKWPDIHRLLNKIASNLRVVRAWFNVYRKGSSYKKHIHAGCDLSGILFLSTGGAATVFEDSYRIIPQAGKIVLFDPSIPHWVEQENEESQRVTLAFNLKG